MNKKTFLKWVKNTGASFLLIFLLPVSVFAASMWVDPPTGRIVVRASREQMKNIEEILPTLPVQARQIKIEARIIEVSSTVTKKFGTYLEKLTGLEVPAGPLGEGGRIAYGPSTLAEVLEGKGALEFTFYKLTSEERFETVLNMLLTEGKAEILSNPRVVTLSGEVAGIYVTTEVPYLSEITYETINEKTVPMEHYDYATVGIVLQVLPRVVGEDLVEMAIIPLVGDYEIVPEFGAQHPVFKRQVSPTNVTVKDGESLVIGGLISKEKSQRVAGLPVFSHLPIIGNVFKSKVDVVEEKNLLITIKPHILKPREIEGRIKKVFQLKYALAEDMAEKIREVISPQGSIEVNPMEAPPNSIVVKDREDKIKLVQLLLNKMGTFEAQRKEKLYKLAFTPLKEAKTAVEHLLSEKGKIRVKEKENAIVVVDGAYQISLIDSAISVLEDYSSFPRKSFFQLKYITASQALEKLKPFISPRGLIQKVDEETIVVEDVRIALKRIEKELENIDIPAK